MRRIGIFCFSLLLAGCTLEDPCGFQEDAAVISATASLPDCRTKMIFEDHIQDGNGIKAGWQTGDTFIAYEINGGTVTPVTFTATSPADVKTSFTSSGAVPADADTRWVAVLGKGARFDGNAIVCAYDGQNGTLAGLENVDYMSATATGASPDFVYDSHMTYLLRILMPEGVGKVEFNMCGSGYGWTVGSDGTRTPCTADYRPKAARTITLPSSTTAGQVVYLAVPAIDYSDAGLIVTAMSADGKKSQGKVCSEDFSKKGGHAGTFDMSFLALMDRPDAADAIRFLSVIQSSIGYINNTSYVGMNDTYLFRNCPRWAPFNLGASANPKSAEDTYGGYFAWGETEPRTAESGKYRYAGKEETIGTERQYLGDSDISMTLRIICGTKYDAARVKWGSAWRLPRLEETVIFTGNNELLQLKAGSVESTSSYFRTAEVSEHDGLEVCGRYLKLNGVEVFFPYAGRMDESAEEASNCGKTGYYWTGTHNVSSGTAEAYRLYVRGNQLDYQSQSAATAFSIRPVVAEETDEPAAPVTVIGHITDSVTGKGIADVCVSDGWNCVTTDADGAYTIAANALARTINVTIPAAYEIPIGEDGSPAFFRRITPGAVSGPVDFVLTPRAAAGDMFTIITVSDAHVQDASNLARFSTTSIPDIQNTVNDLESSGSAGCVIAIALGDQMWDNMDLAGDIRKQYASIRTSSGTMPFFFCIGNHDHQHGLKGIDDNPDYYSTQVYVDNFGPTDYSFDIGNAHIVVMDDIKYSGVDDTGKIKHGNGLTGEQVHWLRQDIANVKDKQNKVGIFCTHSPLYQAIGNGNAIQQALCSFNEGHIFSGHIHNMRNDFQNGIYARSGRSLIEHNIQSLCGMWWLADLSPNGTPAGYGVYTFKGGALYSEYNKTTKEDKSFQMRVYSGNDSYPGYSWDSEYKGKFLVRVWDGDEPGFSATEQTWWLDFVQGGKTTPMTRLSDPIVDKCAASYIVKVLGSPHGTGGTATSFSWWTVDAPSGDPAAEKDWEIVARHRIYDGPEMIYKTSTLSRNGAGYENDKPFN